jgi:purine-binding chemotaxis protein CheW
MEGPEVALGQQNEQSVLVTLKRRAESLAAEQSEEGIEDALSILLFGIGPEWYAVGIESVREIYNEYVVTPVPCVPPSILGVINVRGEIISVTDLRTLLRLPAGETEESSPVIVVENGGCTTALVVDMIGDIADVPKDAVEPPVANVDKSQAACVAGSVFVGGKVMGLLNLEEILAPIGGA